MKYRRWSLHARFVYPLAIGLGLGLGRRVVDVAVVVVVVSSICHADPLMSSTVRLGSSRSHARRVERTAARGHTDFIRNGACVFVRFFFRFSYFIRNRFVLGVCVSL